MLPYPTPARRAGPTRCTAAVGCSASLRPDTLDGDQDRPARERSLLATDDLAGSELPALRHRAVQAEKANPHLFGFDGPPYVCSLIKQIDIHGAAVTHIASPTRQRINYWRATPLPTRLERSCARQIGMQHTTRHTSCQQPALPLFHFRPSRQYPAPNINVLGPKNCHVAAVLLRVP